MIRLYYPGVFHVARELFGELRQYSGPAAYLDVLRPWVGERGRMVGELLAPLSRCGQWRREEYRWGDPLEQAYALSRVNDVLLLGFQPALPIGDETPWAHSLHLDVAWPTVTLDEYRDFCTDLGMTVVDGAEFDPFLHEIVSVEQAGDPGHPVEIVETLWPAVMFGELLFSRSGVRVRAGAQHAVAGVADRATLHNVFLRRYRDTYDGSLGWGHNSQWKTDFRRDYRTQTADHLNVDGEYLDPELRSVVRDVVLNRYATPAAEARLGEFFPWNYRVTLP